MKYKILKFFGFKCCDFCGNYFWKYFMRKITISESEKDIVGHMVYICEDCKIIIREE